MGTSLTPHISTNFSHYLWQDKMMINGFPVLSVIVVIAAVFFRSVAPSSSTGSIVHAVVDNDFDAQLTFAGGKLVVVNFSATWCGPCKRMAPTFEAMSSKFFHHVVFLTVDVDDCEDVAEKYEISAMPTFLFIKNKAMVVSALQGANVDKLKELVATRM